MKTIIFLLFFSVEVKADTAALVRCKKPVWVAYEISETLKRPSGHFTQGFFFQDGALFESTGKRGKSRLLEIKPQTGHQTLLTRLQPQYFGEGSTVWKNRIYWLTWQSGKAFVYDLNSKKLNMAFSYRGEGWGLTSSAKHFIMSDGSEWLRFLSPRDFSVVKKLKVKLRKQPLKKLNELEWVNGKIWANVWQRDWLVKIDPKTGCVDAKLDLSDLRRHKGLKIGPEGDLNGIAYDAKSKNYYVTGKNWSHIFKLKIK